MMTFFTQQVKEISGLRLLWADYKWEKQGNRGRTEQQCWTGCLLIRIGLITRDPCVVPYHLHLPTACRSAIFTQTPTVIDTGSQIRSSIFLHLYLYKHKCGMHLCFNVRPQKNTSKAPELQEWNRLLEQQQQPCRPRLFRFPVTKKNDSQQSVTPIMLP